MVTESEIIRIVKEDILRILGEKKDIVKLKSIKEEIKVSSPYLFKALKELEKNNLIRVENNFIRLTRKGQEKAAEIVDKHTFLEKYFHKPRSEREAHEIAHILEHYVSEEVIKNLKELSTFKEEGMPLTEVVSSKELLITDIRISDNYLFERMVSMGIFPGERIMKISKIASGIIVKINNKKFALDRDIAKEIQVLEYEKS